MALAAAINTAKSFIINKLTEENPDSLYVGNKPNDHEYFQCDLSDIPTTEDAESLRVYHQTNIYVEGLKNFNHPMGDMYSHINMFKISANLPNSFSYSFGGNWVTPIEGVFNEQQNMAVQGASSFLSSIAKGAGLNNVADALTNNFSSTTTLATTALIWKSPNPMEIQLDIPVFDDRTALKEQEAYGYKTDLREVLNLLANLALPSLPEGGNWTGFLRPPPSPLELPIGGNASIDMSNNVMTRVQVGAMLALNQCALTNVTVSYNNTRSLIKQEDLYGNKYLSPLFANLSLKFKTVLGMTTFEIGNMLYLQTPPTTRINLTKGAEKATASLTNMISGKTSELYGKMSGKVSDAVSKVSKLW